MCFERWRELPRAKRERGWLIVKRIDDVHAVYAGEAVVQCEKGVFGNNHGVNRHNPSIIPRIHPRYLHPHAAYRSSTRRPPTRKIAC